MNLLINLAIGFNLLAFLIVIGLSIRQYFKNKKDLKMWTHED